MYYVEFFKKKKRKTPVDIIIKISLILSTVPEIQKHNRNIT